MTIKRKNNKYNCDPHNTNCYCKHCPQKCSSYYSDTNSSNPNIQAELNNSPQILLNTSSKVLFNKVKNESNSNILYNTSKGEFLLPRNKNYYVSWWTSINGTQFSPNVELSIAINNIPISTAFSPQVTCQLSGSAFIPAGNNQKLLSLINTSDGYIRYANTSIQANIVIIEVK